MLPLRELSLLWFPCNLYTGSDVTSLFTSLEDMFPCLPLHSSILHHSNWEPEKIECTSVLELPLVATEAAVAVTQQKLNSLALTPQPAGLRCVFYIYIYILNLYCPHKCKYCVSVRVCTCVYVCVEATPD